MADAYIPKIQPGDILAINVGSLNPLASSFFNPFSNMPVTTDNAGGNGVPGIGGQSATGSSAAR